MDNKEIIKHFLLVKRLIKKIKVLSCNNIQLILEQYWVLLPKNKVLLDWINIEKLDWDLLSQNPNAIDLLKVFPTKINWKYLSKNPNAIELLQGNQDKIHWKSLSSNKNAITILKKNKDKIHYAKLSSNENAINLINEKIKKENKLTSEQYDNLDFSNKICFDTLSSNPNAIDILTKNKDKIHWTFLSENKNGISLLKEKWDQEVLGNNIDYDAQNIISEHLLSTNANVVNILKANPHIISWAYISENINAISIISKKLKYENKHMTIDDYIKLEDDIVEPEYELLNKICWKKLSSNINAITLLHQKINNKERMNIKKNINLTTTFEEINKTVEYIRNRWIDRNPSINIDFNNKCLVIFLDEKLDWSVLSENINAIGILKENQDKIDWVSLSSNPSIFTDTPIPNIY